MENIKNIKKFIESIDRFGGQADEVKSKLEMMFPEITDMEHIGKGMFGNAYIGTRDNNELIVVKMTNSLSEYYMSKMAMQSNPPNTVKFFNVEVYDEDKHLYVITHEWVSRDAMPNKEIWDGTVNRTFSKKEIERFTKSEKYEAELAKTKTDEIENFFGLEIDSLQQNWGYTDDRELVIFDLDGNISRPKYMKFMKEIVK